MTVSEPPSDVLSSPDGLRGHLTELLQEEDPHRPLDSLEAVVVRGFVTRRLPHLDPPAPDETPRTIEGWVTWAVHRSAAS